MRLRGPGGFEVQLASAVDRLVRVPAASANMTAVAGEGQIGVADSVFSCPWGRIWEDRKLLWAAEPLGSAQRAHHPAGPGAPVLEPLAAAGRLCGWCRALDSNHDGARNLITQCVPSQNGLV